ncbi:hypothetical protein KUTeg_008169 [Tegillarca granosa]|uniref:RETREG1-3/ARL6IP-like N-terminal reticulon-homology domain-containing protein n=1 Tax=Tegillarca granosa TaxID=220873 RepID=A0ABQ9F8C1_TEGGR|nr:hypothetical protein KUTeg_008169 [Tegillarca granosa]
MIQKMDNLANQNMDDDVKSSEETFKSFLSPIEPLVMRIQSLLVWENPKKSAVLFIIVHLIFWFFAVFGLPPPIPEDPDSWTPVHPRLLSVPEICQYLAQMWCSFIKYIKSWLIFRSNHPFLFCLLTSIIFIIFAVIGRYIPDIMLLYIIVISIMLWPSVLYHNLVQKCYLKFEPIFMQLDYKLKLKNKWSSKKSKPKAEVSHDDNGDTVETDSEEDFIPSLDPEATAALAKAITDSEDESGTGTPSVPTPRLSKTPSIDLNDDIAEFAEGLGDMPSFDDNLDHTDDELLEFAPELPSEKIKSKKKDRMEFVPSHFGDTSDSDEDTLTKDLKHTDRPRTSKQTSGDDETASSIVSQAFSTVMASALSGIANLAQSTVVYTPDRDTTDSVRSRQDSDIPTTLQRDTRYDTQESLHHSDSSDIDIADEFEFLDDYESEIKDPEKK